MVDQYVATRPIMDLCKEAEQRTGERFSKWWWEKEGINLDGEWATKTRSDDT